MGTRPGARPGRCQAISTLHGNLLGLSPAEKHRLERLYRRRIPTRSIVSHELAREMASISHALNRRLGLLVDRAGRVEAVAVGDARRVTVPRQPSAPAGRLRFCTLRFLATRLADDDALGPEELAPLALHRLDAMAIIGVEDDGETGRVRVAHLLPAPARPRDANGARPASADAEPVLPPEPLASPYPVPSAETFSPADEEVSFSQEVPLPQEVPTSQEVPIPHELELEDVSMGRALIRDEDRDWDRERDRERDRLSAVERLVLLRELSREPGAAASLGPEGRARLLERIGSGWAGRRALTQMIRDHSLEDLDEALLLAERLGSPVQQGWCLGDLLEHWELDDADRRKVIEAASSDASRRRLERRSARMS